MSEADLQLLVDMGFPRERAEAALSAVGNQGLEAAAEWLLSHSEDAGGGAGHVLGAASTEDRQSGTALGGGTAASDSSPGEHLLAAPLPQARSLKCEDCGKQLRSEQEAERHAARTNHQNFSESVEEVKPLTEEEKKAQLARLEERLKQNRAARLEQERVEAKQREQMRRKTNKEISQAREELELREARKLAEQKKREREEDRLAKQRVRDQIAKDRAEKAAREKAEKAAREAASSGGGAGAAHLTTSHTDVGNPATSSQPKKDYDTCRLQIRQFDGQPLTHSFNASETLVDVNRFIMMNRAEDENTPFSLMTSFPRRVFTPDEMNKTLKELGLVPSSVLILTRLS